MRARSSGLIGRRTGCAKSAIAEISGNKRRTTDMLDSLPSSRRRWTGVKVLTFSLGLTRLSCKVRPGELGQKSLKSRSGTGGRSGVLQTKVVVDGMAEFLLAAQVTLGRLNRCVAEEELYLLQFSICQMAQPGAGATQIVWGKILDSSASRSAFHDMPYRR